VDRPTRQFGVPDGLLAVGLFGGALVLAGLALAGLNGTGSSAESSPVAPLVIAAGVVALGLVLGIGVVLLRRLRGSAATLEHRSREVEETASRLQVLVEHVPAAVYIDLADPEVTDGGRLAYMSPQITGILGYQPNDLVDDPELWPGRIHPEDRAAAIAAYEEHWRSGQPLRAEYRMLTRDGTEVWVRDEAYAMADDTQSGRRMSQGLLVDITDHKRLESKLIHDALHDPLTGLANRVLLRDHLERALARLGRSHGSVALLFVDLDDFKRVNDGLGHDAGDELLVAVAHRLQACVRPEDTVARLGGDEFAILLDRAETPEVAAAAARRVLDGLRTPFTLRGNEVPVSASLGVALGAESELDDLLREADIAMYMAKAHGKARFELATGGVPAAASAGPPPSG
jgi:diguanylate cyclase (GGDEF)-like protein/PAS domain S-box-containing protein